MQQSPRLWTVPVQVPCPKKPEGHVSVAGVTPPHAPGRCYPSRHMLLAPRGCRGECGDHRPPWHRGGVLPCCILLHGRKAAARPCCSRRHWAEAHQPWQAAGLGREFPPGRAPEAGAGPQELRRRGCRVFIIASCSCLLSRAAAFGSAAALRPVELPPLRQRGWRPAPGAAAGKPVPSRDPLPHTSGPAFSEPFPRRSGAGVCRGAPVRDAGGTAAPAAPSRSFGKRAGNNPRSPAPGAFSCCASL